MIPSFIKKLVQAPFESLVGQLGHWQVHRRNLRARPSLPQALRNIEGRWPVPADEPDDRPVFLLSAGWRSGSTLLQRLIMSGNDILMWGEPYPHCDYIRSLAQSLSIFRSDQPPDQFFIRPPSDTMAGAMRMDEWIACLYPNPGDLVRAHRAFFRTLYAAPALERGYRRWGLKEVVLAAEHALYLRWLFPGARFLFLYRDPYAAYRSYRTFGDWYFRWPAEPVFTAAKFGWVWRTLTEGFMKDHTAVGGMLVKYEDLVSGAVSPQDLSQYVETPVRAEVLTKRVTGRKPAALEPIPRLEFWQLQRAVEPLAGSLGYEAAR
jgi:hypothetical protein